MLEASDGEEALRIFSENIVDLAILDIMMPKLDGLAVCRNIREVSNTPIILLTAKSQEEDKLLGYELGADDYMTKPFSPKVLLAKAKALLRRPGTLNDKNILDFNGLTINKLSHEVKLNGEEWSAISKDKVKIEKGKIVEVIQIEGVKLIVREVSNINLDLDNNKDDTDSISREIDIKIKTSE